MAAGIGVLKQGRRSSPWVCSSNSSYSEVVTLDVGGIKNPSADLTHPAAKTKGAMI